jgi:hypothetical protein
MANEDELAALKARVAELERAAKPAPPPDMKGYRRFDPTEGMSMPASALREMAQAIPDSFIRDIVHDNRAPAGPSAQGVIPSSQQVSDVRLGNSGRSGWAYEAPLGPSSHQRYVDAQLDAQDAKDRAEARRATRSDAGHAKARGAEAMSDEQTSDQRLAAKIRKDLEAFENDPIAKGQAALDRWWQLRLDARAARNVPRPGDYDPVARFDREMDELVERQDRVHHRR